MLPPDTHLADGGRPIGGRANGGRMTGTMRVAGAMPPTPRGARLAMPRGAPAPSPGRKERGKLGAGWIMGRGRQQWGMGLANEMNTCIHRWQFLEVLFVGRCLLNLNNVFAKKTAHTVLHILFNAFFCHFCELPGHFSFTPPPQEMVKIQKSLLDWMFLTFFWQFSVLSTFFLNTLFCFSHENKRTAKYASTGLLDDMGRSYELGTLFDHLPLGHLQKKNIHFVVFHHVLKRWVVCSLNVGDGGATIFLCKNMLNLREEAQKSQKCKKSPQNRQKWQFTTII